jgi:hypothetical protein
MGNVESIYKYPVSIIFCLLAALLFACSQSTSRLMQQASYPDLEESRLGDSRYILHYPRDMFIEEARGKEGQLGYGLWLKDSINRFSGFSGFIEIAHGNGISADEDRDSSIETVKSRILGKYAIWKIKKTSTGFYTSSVKHKGITFSASAPRKSGLDSIIAILSTLEVR